MLSKISNIISKKNKSKIICLTAYSKNIAEEIDKYTDLILVGDSLGSVLYNFNSTRDVTLDMMIKHSKSVRLGITKSLMMVDIPYNTYRTKSEALKNSKRVIKETKCDGIKLEGGLKVKNIVEHLVKNKIPVLGHLGLLPQSVRGKFKSKGKTEKQRKEIMRDAKMLEKAGVFGIVLECVEKSLSKEITKSIKVPTIGIGSSKYCDGQVLVSDDIFGLTGSKTRFAKKFVDLKKYIRQAVKNYKTDVLKNKYPSKKHSY